MIRHPAVAKALNKASRRVARQVRACYTPRPETLFEETPEGKEILGLVDKLGEAAGVRREEG